MDSTRAQLDKLLARLDSPYRAEAVASAGKIYDYLQKNGGTWRELLGNGSVASAPSLVRTPRNLSKRVRKASRALHFLAPSERTRLARIAIELEDYDTLAKGDFDFLEEIFLRTRV